MPGAATSSRSRLVADLASARAFISSMPVASRSTSWTSRWRWSGRCREQHLEPAAAPRPSRLIRPTLTARESEVVSLIADGMSNAAIAAELRPQRAHGQAPRRQHLAQARPAVARGRCAAAFRQRTLARTGHEPAMALSGEAASGPVSAIILPRPVVVQAVPPGDERGRRWIINRRGGHMEEKMLTKTLSRGRRGDQESDRRP